MPVYPLLANQEGCSGDTDDMDGCAGFNEARAQVRYVRRFTDDQNSGAKGFGIVGTLGARCGRVP